MWSKLNVIEVDSIYTNLQCMSAYRYCVLMCTDFSDVVILALLLENANTNEYSNISNSPIQTMTIETNY